jgi:hypothetical protein
MACSISAHAYDGLVEDVAFNRLPGVASFLKIVGYAPDKTTLPLLKTKPTFFHAGVLPSRRGGVFIQSDGDSFKLKGGKGQGIPQNHTFKGVWTGMTKEFGLGRDAGFMLEGWLSLPCKNDKKFDLPVINGAPVRPDAMAGASFKLRF